MQRLKTILFTILGVVAGVSGTSLANELLADSTSWTTYLNNEIMPYVTIAVASISTIALAVTPVVTQVKAIIDRVKTTSDDIKNTAKNGQDATLVLQEYSKTLEDLSTQVKELSKDVSNVNTMCKIGFTNTTELVANGYAAQIEKVGVEDVKEEVAL